MAAAGSKRYCELAFEELDLGLRVDLSRLGIDAARLDAYDTPMRAAFDAMEALEAGAVANPDEQRMVGHYWLRAPDRAPAPGLTAVIRDTQARIAEFAHRVHEGGIRPARAPRFRRVLLVGIGGSALGPQLVADALGTAQDRLPLHFLDNTDPDGFDRVLAAIGPALGETLTIVISKSGGTAETRNGMLEVAHAYRALALRFGAHAVAVTQDGSALARYAHDHGFVEQFPMWDWVGGRTSVTSAVGLLPAALQGVDVRALLEGAAAMDDATRRHDLRRNPSALLAAAWHFAADGRGAKDLVVLPYKDRLVLLSRYLQQLVMESLGKERDLEGRAVNQGLTVYGNKGSTDQHAYIQQLREGVPNFFAMFVRVLEDRHGPSLEIDPGVTSGDFLDGFLLGTRQALWDNNRPSLTITIPAVNARTLGMIIALFERTVGFYASLVGINAYHQPGVEAGKKAASAILALQGRAVKVLQDTRGEALSADDVAIRAGHPDEAETVLLVLEHLAANPGRGVRRRPGRTLCEATFSWVGTVRA